MGGRRGLGGRGGRWCEVGGCGLFLRLGVRIGVGCWCCHLWTELWEVVFGIGIFEVGGEFLAWSLKAQEVEF